MKRRLTPGQPAGYPEENACFLAFRGEHINFFVRLTGRLSQGQPDPDQSKTFMFMCLFLFLLTQRQGKSLRFLAQSMSCWHGKPGWGFSSDCDSVCSVFVAKNVSVAVRLAKGMFATENRADLQLQFLFIGNGANTVSGSTVSNTELSEFFGAFTEFRGEHSVSSSHPLISVPKRTHRVFPRTHRVCPKTQ